MKWAERAGITYQQSLSDIIINNTELGAADVRDNMFIVAQE
ncbi:MAG: hypothetical protein AAF404_04650 [Pseudomonadota bacterium]